MVATDDEGQRRGLIAPQMTRVSARRGYIEARLAALWPEITGPEVAAIARPGKLTLSRGPARGADGPRLQVMLPRILDTGKRGTRRAGGSP